MSTGCDLGGTDLGRDGGAIGMTFLPGKRYMGYYSGPHWRDADSDAASLRAQGVDVLLLLVEDHELERCRSTELATTSPTGVWSWCGIHWWTCRLPPMVSAYRERLVGLLDRVRDGTKLAVACRGGLDRAGMTSACLLREAGLDADTAIDRVHSARRHTLSLPNQLEYVREWPSDS